MSNGPDVDALAIHDHAHDVLCLLDYARSPELKRNHVANKLASWLVHRCWQQISHRLATSKKEWREDPVSYMCRAPHISFPMEEKSAENPLSFANHPDNPTHPPVNKAVLSADKPISPASTPPKLLPAAKPRSLKAYAVYAGIYSLFSENSLSADETDQATDMVTYTLTDASAPSWLKCIGGIIENLRSLLSTPSKSCPDSAILYQVDVRLRALNVILTSAISELFIDNDFWAHSISPKIYDGTPLYH
jgi:hypothetical protein